MKKGFTLIEILAVVTIIGLIFVIALPKIINSLNSKKSDIDNTTNNMIISAAKMYVNDHNTKFDKIEGSVYCLPLTTLTKEEYLDSKVKNVTDDKDITNIKSVKISYDNTFHYEIVNKKDCSVINKNYTELNYLESTGTQYIDTLYVPTTNNLKVELEVYAEKIPTIEADFFGNVINADISAGRIVSGFYRGYVFLYSRTSKTGSNDGNVTNNNFQVNEKNKIIIEYDGVNKKRNLTINNINTSSSTFNTQIVNTNKLALFAAGLDYDVSKSSMRLYYCKIYDNNDLVRDFIPVRDYNGIACLYDKVENKYYYNQGTGEFIAGPIKSR